MKTLLGLSAVVSVLLAGVYGSEARSARPQPKLLLNVPTPILAFAADGSELAWLRKTRPGCAVFFRRIVEGSVSKTTVEDREFCPFDGTDRGLALAGTRALWALATAGHNAEGIVETASIGQRRGRVLLRLNTNPGVRGDNARGVAGDGGTLAYAVDSFACTENPDSTVDCTPVENASSGVWRVAGPRANRLHRAPAIAIATGGGRIAVVPSPEGTSLPTIVELRSATTGTLQRRVDAGASIGAVALSRTVLVASTTHGIKLFDPRTGASVGSVRVPHVNSLFVSEDSIAVVTWRVIRMIDARTKRVSILTSRRLFPVSVTVEGRRVLWAENPRGHGRIYSLALPR